MLPIAFAQIIVKLRVDSSIHIHLLLRPLWQGGFGPPPHQVPQHKQVLFPCNRCRISLDLLPVDQFLQVRNRPLVHLFWLEWGEYLVDPMLLFPVILYVIFLRIFSLKPWSLFYFTLHLQDGLTQPLITVTEDYTNSDSFIILDAFFEGPSLITIIVDPILGGHNIQTRKDGSHHRSDCNGIKI